MLTAFELSQVEQATDAYCQLKRIQGEGERKAVYSQMLVAFVSRKTMNLRDAQVSWLVDLDGFVLTDVLKVFPRIE